MVSIDVLTELLFLLVLIVASAFFSAAEIAIISIHRARLRQMVDDGVPGARLVQSLAANSSRLLVITQVGVTLANFLIAATAAMAFVPPLTAWLEASRIPLVSEYATLCALILVTLALIPLMLIFGKLLPRSLAAQYNERVALLVGRPLTAVAAILLPGTAIFAKVTDQFLRLLGGRHRTSVPLVTEEEIKTLVDAGEEIGVIEEDEKQMIYAVFGLSETTVREVMTPRVDMVMVAVDTPMRDAARQAVRSGYSRLPVYKETPDNVVGILHVKDLLAALSADTSPADLRPLLRPPHVVPETKRVDELLREMQNAASHMAIVADEYGGTAGLVTIEDLLEEIVGEIRDEHDRDEVQIQRVDEQTVIFHARVTLERVNELMGLDLAYESADTLGGYVAALLEKVPVRGDRLTVRGAVIEVVAAAGRRAKQVKVTRTEGRDDSVREDA